MARRKESYLNRRGGVTDESKYFGGSSVKRENKVKSNADTLNKATGTNAGTRTVRYKSSYSDKDRLGNSTYAGNINKKKTAAQIQAQMRRIEAQAKSYKAQKGGGANKRAHLNRAYAAATAVQDYQTLGKAGGNGGIEAEDYRSKIKGYSAG